jgi:flagellar motility protein MotE (MotC chaperone)
VWTVNSIKEMATALKYLKECKGVKSEADIREQEARIRNLEKQAEADANANTEVTVKFEAEGEKSEWAE